MPPAPDAKKALEANAKIKAITEKLRKSGAAISAEIAQQTKDAAKIAQMGSALAKEGEALPADDLDDA
jgi:hypothetical protein